jgi:hypothetical protein
MVSDLALILGSRSPRLGASCHLQRNRAQSQDGSAFLIHSAPAVNEVFYSQVVAFTENLFGQLTAAGLKVGSFLS